MSNLYHKVAIASICTALGFTLGANKEAEAATFSNQNYYWLASQLTFSAIDGDPYGSFDGLGDRVTGVSYNNNSEDYYPHSWGYIGITDAREVAALIEFSTSHLTSYIANPDFTNTNSKITRITNAVLRIGAGMTDYALMGAFGYVGNGIPEASDFEAGVFLNSVDISFSSTDDILRFDVTPFVNQLVNSNNAFAGFTIRASNFGGVTLNAYDNNSSLVIEAEPIPEPTTIFGSVLALSLGGWLKRKNSSQNNKTTSQI